MVLDLTESVTIPKELLKDLCAGLVQVEEVLATIEELMDEKSLKRIRKAEDEYRKGKYVTVKRSREIGKLE